MKLLLLMPLAVLGKFFGGARNGYGMAMVSIKIAQLAKCFTKITDPEDC